MDFDLDSNLAQLDLIEPNHNRLWLTHGLRGPVRPRVGFKAEH